METRLLSPRESPQTRTTALITGHFHEKKGYATWRQRGTQDWLLIDTVAGLGYFGYPSATGHLRIPARPGDVVLLKPGTLHDYGTDDQWHFLWTHFQPRPHWLDWLHWPPVSDQSPGLMRLTLADRQDRSRIQRGLARMHALAHTGSPRRHDFALNALEEVLLALDALNPLQAQSHLDPRIRSTIDLLSSQLHEKLTLNLLARRVHLSVSRLAHLFRQQTGITPQRFLELKRLDRAKQLLALTPTSIKEIAYQVGFQNPFYFTLRFKRYTSQSPKAFRRAHAR